MDRLARQVQEVVRASGPGGDVEVRVAAAVGAILDATMRRVARARGGRWGSDGEPSIEAWQDPLELGSAYEGLLALRPRLVSGELEFKPRADGRHARKQRGAYYTPNWMVNLVLDAALDPVMSGMSEAELMRLRVLDPACGSGHFLVAAADRIAERLAESRGKESAGEREQKEAARCVFGVDSDPVAVSLCRAAVWRPGVDDDQRIVVGDGLVDELPGLFDAVVGNPPFLNRLERATNVQSAAAERLKARYGDAARAYTDVSALFLLRAVELTREGGLTAMVQPQSILTSRDAAGVRRAVMQRGTLESIWLADAHHFDAAVFVCVPTVRVGADTQGPVRRQRGAARLSPVLLSTEGMAADSWGALGAGEGPEARVEVRGTEETVGDIAQVAADFRDEYYGLRGMVVEDVELAAHARDRYPALITTGLLDPACCSWGKAPCRFAGQRWESPRVDLARLKRETDLGPWAEARLKPKVLLATQTRVLEAAVDEHARWLPVTPLISIMPNLHSDLWRIGAALNSPVLTALALQRSAGAALTRDAIKLSATQVRGLPMPNENRHTTDATELFKQACRADDTRRAQLLERCALASCLGFGMKQDRAAELTAWWCARARLNHVQPAANRFKKH